MLKLTTSSIKRGDIYRVRLDPAEGSEIKKTRPCVIVQNNVGNEHSSNTIIAPVTKYTGKTYPDFETLLDPDDVLHVGSESGLSKISRVVCDQVRVVSKSRLIEKIGHVSPDKMKEVDEALKVSLGLKSIS